MEKIYRPMPTKRVERVVGDALSSKRSVAVSIEKLDFKHRINHKDEFELSYLRWRYLMRAKNPKAEVIKKYEKAAYFCARKSYDLNYAIYKSSGMELEDVNNIALVYLVSYLGSMSIEYTPAEKKKFVKHFKEVHGKKPTIEEIRRKDLSKMICFVQQRFIDLIRVCRQKNKNVTGEKTLKGVFVLEGVERDVSDWAILDSPATFGFRKLTTEETRELKNSTKNKRIPQGRFVIDGKVYRNATHTFSSVNVDDYESNYDSIVFLDQDPEDFDISQNQKLKNRFRMERLLDVYKKASPQKKARMLQRIVYFLGKNPEMKNELSLAKRLLDKVKLEHGR